MNISTQELNKLISKISVKQFNKIVEKYEDITKLQKCNHCGRYILGLMCCCNDAQKDFENIIKEIKYYSEVL